MAEDIPLTNITVHPHPGDVGSDGQYPIKDTQTPIPGGIRIVSQEGANCAFELQMKRLSDTLEEALAFLNNLNDSFTNETSQIRSYASPEIIDELWLCKTASTYVDVGDIKKNDRYCLSLYRQISESMGLQHKAGDKNKPLPPLPISRKNLQHISTKSNGI